MKRLHLLLVTLLLSNVLLSCSKDKDPVLPANVLVSSHGIKIELEWSTGGSSNQALNESDLDLYLDKGEVNIQASENRYSFEEVYLRDIYKDGTYDVYVGAFDVSRRTSYHLYISAPGAETIHHYTGYLTAGENGEVRYLSIRKEGRRYILVDL